MHLPSMTTNDAELYNNSNKHNSAHLTTYSSSTSAYKDYFNYNKDEVDKSTGNT